MIPSSQKFSWHIFGRKPSAIFSFLFNNFQDKFAIVGNVIIQEVHFCLL